MKYKYIEIVAYSFIISFLLLMTKFFFSFMLGYEIKIYEPNIIIATIEFIISLFLLIFIIDKIIIFIKNEI